MATPPRSGLAHSRRTLGREPAFLLAAIRDPDTFLEFLMYALQTPTRALAGQFSPQQRSLLREYADWAEELSSDFAEDAEVVRRCWSASTIA